MKSIQSLLIIGIVFSMILNSCSIEKRVHRSGYHIQWHKIKQDSKPQDVNFKNEAKQLEQEINLTEVNTENKIIKSENSEFSSLENKLTSKEKASEISFNNPNSITNKKSISRVELNPISEFNSELKNENKTQSTRREQNNLKNLSEGKSGLFMIILGLILFGLAWIFYAYLGIFGLIMALIFGIGAAIYLIVGLIVLLVNA